MGSLAREAGPRRRGSGHEAERRRAGGTERRRGRRRERDRGWTEIGIEEIGSGRWPDGVGEREEARGSVGPGEIRGFGWLGILSREEKK